MLKLKLLEDVTVNVTMRNNPTRGNARIKATNLPLLLFSPLIAIAISKEKHAVSVSASASASATANAAVFFG